MLKDQFNSDWSFSLLDFSNEFWSRSRLPWLQKVHSAIMQVISLMLNRSRCDTTATEVRHFPCRTFRQKIARLFLNVLRQRLSSLRLSDFRLSTKVLPIAVQMVLPMLVSLVHLQNWSLICSVTFLIRCPPHTQKHLQRTQFDFTYSYSQSVQVVLGPSVLRIGICHDSKSSSRQHSKSNRNQIEWHAECL